MTDDDFFPHDVQAARIRFRKADGMVSGYSDAEVKAKAAAIDPELAENAAVVLAAAGERDLLRAALSTVPEDLAEVAEALLEADRLEEEAQALPPDLREDFLAGLVWARAQLLQRLDALEG